MVEINQRISLSYDDVLLEPRPSKVSSKTVKTDVDLAGLKLGIPVISSPMDTVTEAELAIGMAQAGGLGIIHRNLEVAGRCAQMMKVKKVKAKMGAAVDQKGKLLVGVAIGPQLESLDDVEELLQAGADVICIDSAQGQSDFVVNTVKEFKKKFPDVRLMAGNVATTETAEGLLKAGADILRVGIGPGAICTTRIVAGIGVPQFSAVCNTVEIADTYGVPVVADGGIKYSGDMVKALAAGAQVVMLGSLLARTAEAPGAMVEIDGKRYKQYRGMGSVGAMKDGSASRYGQEGVQESAMVAEGVEGLVPYEGDVADYLHQLVGGLRAGMAYIGAKDVDAMKKQARFVQITQASLVESHPHSMQVTNGGKNYR